MRQRVTLFQRPGEPVNPESLKITSQTLNGPEVRGIREERATFALDELPGDLQALLGSHEELYIRWVAAEAHDTVSPLFSRLPPGLHLFYSPKRGNVEKVESICTSLKKAFGNLDCESPESSFIASPSGAGRPSPAFQYWQPLKNLSHFIKFSQNSLCSESDPLCSSLVEKLDRANSLDVTYDASLKVLRTTATWIHDAQSLFVTAVPGHRTEVGILAPDKPPNLGPTELGIAGHLTVIGDGSKPSATIFGFPSRHRHANGTSFSSQFAEPTGLHPTLRLRFDGPSKPPVDDAQCSLHAYMTLPRTIFADRYQLSDPLFMASKNLSALRHMSEPVDLEAPEYAVNLWGSTVLLKLAPPISGLKSESWTAEIPLHLRYLRPAQGGYATTEIPYPVIFWACKAADGPDFANNPFDRTHLGYDTFFDDRTVFWHVDPRPAPADAGAAGSSRLISTVRVPVLDTDKAAWVNAGTAAVIALGFGWILWRLFSVYLRTGYGAATGEREAADKKKKSQ